MSLPKKYKGYLTKDLVRSWNRMRAQETSWSERGEKAIAMHCFIREYKLCAITWPMHDPEARCAAESRAKQLIDEILSPHTPAKRSKREKIGASSHPIDKLAASRKVAIRKHSELQRCRRFYGYVRKRRCRMVITLKRLVKAE